MVYGELGVFPLNIKIKIRAVTYWARLLNTNYNKLSSNIYKLLYHLAIKNSYVSPWILYIRGILNDCGFPYLWLNQDLNCSVDWFKSVISNRLKDQFIQLWNETINRSGKCINYRMFVSEFKLENYLINLPFPSRKLLAKFRCRNHKLPIEKDCHLGLPREQRLCKKCDLSEIGDEFHYLFRYNYFVKERRKYIKCKYYNLPSTLKFEELMCKQDIFKFIMCVEHCCSITIILYYIILCYVMLCYNYCIVLYLPGICMSLNPLSHIIILAKYKVSILLEVLHCLTGVDKVTIFSSNIRNIQILD